MVQKISRPAVAGIVLVGGRSSRMGTDKALLEYEGQPLYRHMTGLLQASGLPDVFLAGQLEGVANCIAEPVPHGGPARALVHVMQQLQKRFDFLLVVPVDMPLLTPALLQNLLQRGAPCSYAEHPLPAVLACAAPADDIHSVHGLLAAQQALALALPEGAEAGMQNFNTPKDWQRLQEGIGEQQHEKP